MPKPMPYTLTLHFAPVPTTDDKGRTWVPAPEIVPAPTPQVAQALADNALLNYPEVTHVAIAKMGVVYHTVRALRVQS